MAVPILPNEVVTAMAKREHRLSHMVWHGLRNAWNGLTNKQRSTILKLYPGWAPPRPITWDASGQPTATSYEGEDFFYMHRKMIEHVNQILSTVGAADYPKVEGWKHIPPPTDSDYPVPPQFTPEDIPDKTDPFWKKFYVAWEAKFNDSTYLQSVSLSQLGLDIEFSIHNSMHMRWAAQSAVGYRSGSLATPVDAKWDKPAYDWLGDTYSSHVNPVFWKLHGWIDDRVGIWQKANGVTSIKWNGTWLGPMGSDHTGHQHNFMAAPMEMDKTSQLEQALSVLGEAGFTGFVRDIRLPELVG